MYTQVANLTCVGNIPCDLAERIWTHFQPVLHVQGSFDKGRGILTMNVNLDLALSV